MEFRYRAGEDPSSSLESYFTTTRQSMRGGFFGGDFRRSEMLRNPMSARDALMREMEKERIREEIIAREIVWRRELEEEVRREMAMERELSLRRQADQFSLASSSVASRKPKLIEFRVDERKAPILDRNDIGRNDDVSRDDLIIRPIAEVSEEPKAMLGKSSTNHVLAGTKRKATVVDDLLQSASLKKAQKDWSCDLCGVSTTGTKALMEHFKGKKHQTKERHLKTDKTCVKIMEISDPKKGLLDKGTATNKTGVNSNEISDPMPKKGLLDKGTSTNKKGVNSNEISNPMPEKGLLDKGTSTNKNGVNSNEISDPMPKKGLLDACTTDKTGVNSNEISDLMPKKGLLDKGTASNEPDSNPTMELEEKHHQVGVTEVGKKAVFTFKCAHCDIKCNSEVMMVTHLKGKKHAAKVQALVGGGGTAPDITAGLKDQKSEEAVARSEKVEQGNTLAAETAEELICEATKATEVPVIEEAEVVGVGEEARIGVEAIQDDVRGTGSTRY